MIALLVKLSSPGPVFHACTRVGLKGEPIRCWKFRTMCTDAEQRLAEVLSTNPSMREEWDRFYKLKDDPRVVPVGRLLRTTSLDEFPQFWNVLCGSLSVVGPRPVTQDEVDRYYGDKRDKLLSVRPGLTGVWQTSGRSLVSFDERLRLEESYIDTPPSLAHDLGIILKTVPLLFGAKGAF
jgi:lipopolysaccharide/colanic/teichoic acid biosynthesis glycosyltransferase